MLMQTIIEELHDKLVGLEIFEHVHELCETMYDSKGNFAPHEYVSHGTYKRINISSMNGIAYFKKNGTVGGFNPSSQALTGCATLIGVSIPIKVIAFKQKTKLPIDNAYSDDWLAEKIIPEITMKSGKMKQKIGAQSITIEFSSYDTDSKNVWSRETNEQFDVNSKIACVSVDINVLINIDRKCFNTICGYGQN